MRWVLFSTGLVGAASVIFLHTTGKPELGQGASRLYSLSLGIAGVLLAIGALFRSPVGWYAAAGLVAATAFETTIRWRAIQGYEGRYRAIWAVYGVANLALLAYLITASGRRLFGLDPR